MVGPPALRAGISVAVEVFVAIDGLSDGIQK